MSKNILTLVALVVCFGAFAAQPTVCPQDAVELPGESPELVQAKTALAQANAELEEVRAKLQRADGEKGELEQKLAEAQAAAANAKVAVITAKAEAQRRAWLKPVHTKANPSVGTIYQEKAGGMMQVCIRIDAVKGPIWAPVIPDVKVISQKCTSGHKIRFITAVPTQDGAGWLYDFEEVKAAPAPANP